MISCILFGYILTVMQAPIIIWCCFILFCIGRMVSFILDIIKNLNK